jgi:ATP-dependent DNA helicase Rep
MTLSPEQLAAVTATEPCVVVSSCPGSGKTRVIVERIHHLIQSGVSPERICVVTFTHAAAKEIQERLQCKTCGGSGVVTGVDPGVSPEAYSFQCPNCRGCPLKLAHAGTLHQLLLKAIRKTPSVCGYSSPPSVLNEAGAEELLKESMAEIRYKGSLKEVRERAARVMDALEPADKVDIIAAYYQQKMVDAGVIDYDGILRCGLMMIRAGKWPFQFEHLVVDEAQDSSDMDFCIYEEMPVVNRYFCGDADQRIMSFRGASERFGKMCLEAI